MFLSDIHVSVSVSLSSSLPLFLSLKSINISLGDDFFLKSAVISNPMGTATNFKQRHKQAYPHTDGTSSNNTLKSALGRQ